MTTQNFTKKDLELMAFAVRRYKISQQDLLPDSFGVQEKILKEDIDRCEGVLIELEYQMLNAGSN